MTPSTKAPQPTLTTEYTPIQRGGPPAQNNATAPAVAPPSHPSIEPTATGIFDGRSILELDLSALAEKQWRRPGSDISDWFNYGFDELSWEAYCYRRRDLGELANVLKPNVIVSLNLNFIVIPTQFDDLFVCRTLLVCRRTN